MKAINPKLVKCEGFLSQIFEANTNILFLSNLLSSYIADLPDINTLNTKM